MSPSGVVRRRARRRCVVKAWSLLIVGALVLWGCSSSPERLGSQLEPRGRFKDVEVRGVYYAGWDYASLQLALPLPPGVAGKVDGYDSDIDVQEVVLDGFAFSDRGYSMSLDREAEVLRLEIQQRPSELEDAQVSVLREITRLVVGGHVVLTGKTQVGWIEEWSRAVGHVWTHPEAEGVRVRVEEWSPDEAELVVWGVHPDLLDFELLLAGQDLQQVETNSQDMQRAGGYSYGPKRRREGGWVYEFEFDSPSPADATLVVRVSPSPQRYDVEVRVEGQAMELER